MKSVFSPVLLVAYTAAVTAIEMPCVFQDQIFSTIDFTLSDEGELFRDSSTTVQCQGILSFENLPIVSIRSGAFSNITFAEFEDPSVYPEIIVLLNANAIQSIAENSFSNSDITI
eukprot:Awhi_evm1s2902